jgi:NADH dehydrogenase
VSHLLELVEEADRNKDGNIDFSEWEIMGRSTLMKLLCTNSLRSVKRIKKKIPMAASHLEKVCARKSF